MEAKVLIESLDSYSMRTFRVVAQYPSEGSAPRLVAEVISGPSNAMGLPNWVTAREEDQSRYIASALYALILKL
jgi:hypothetical protein